MPLNLEDKKALVAEVSEIAAKAQSVVAAEYRGITVTQMTELRAKARGQGVYMRVVKNTLARKALVGTSFEVDRTEAEGSARTRVLEGRSRRRRARGEGLREGRTTSSFRPSFPSADRFCPPRISTRSRASRRRSRRCSAARGCSKPRSRSWSAPSPSPRRSSSARSPPFATRNRPPASELVY